MKGLLAALVVLAMASLSGQERAAPPASRVPIYVTVTSPFAEPLPRLTAEDFVLLDNARPHPILSLSGGDTSVALSLVLDLSGGMFLEAMRLIPAVDTLIRAVPVDGRPGMSLIGRSWRPSDEWRAVGLRIIPDLQRLGIRREYGRRPLWSECVWAMTSVTFRRARRVLVVVTDGPGKGDLAKAWQNPMDLRIGETMDETSERELLEHVDREDVLVYAVGFEGSKFDDVVKRVAVRSGGRVITLTRNGDLNVVFQQIADEIRGQYILTFEPPAFDGKKHSLEVQIKRKNLEVRTRREYTASKRPIEY